MNDGMDRQRGAVCGCEEERARFSSCDRKEEVGPIVVCIGCSRKDTQTHIFGMMVHLAAKTLQCLTCSTSWTGADTPPCPAPFDAASH